MSHTPVIVRDIGLRRWALRVWEMDAQRSSPRSHRTVRLVHCQSSKEECDGISRLKNKCCCLKWKISVRRWRAPQIMKKIRVMKQRTYCPSYPKTSLYGARSFTIATRTEVQLRLLQKHRRTYVHRTTDRCTSRVT